MAISHLGRMIGLHDCERLRKLLELHRETGECDRGCTGEEDLERLR